MKQGHGVSGVGRTGAPGVQYARCVCGAKFYGKGKTYIAKLAKHIEEEEAGET